MMRKRRVPLGNHVMHAFRGGDVAKDLGDRADAMELAGGGVLDRRIRLEDDAQHALATRGLLRTGDRGRPSDRKGQNDSGE